MTRVSSLDLVATAWGIKPLEPWVQNYDPAESWLISTLLAALPILTLLGVLVVARAPAWKAAGAALLVSLATAVLGFRMPWTMALAAAFMGSGFGLIRIVYLVVAAMFLYDLAVAAGRFEVMKATIAGLSPDRRIQAVLVAFSFGAFLEGCAGFGAPVAIVSAFLVGLGFRPMQAAVLALVGNTAPVSWGSVGIPLTTLAAVSGQDVHALSLATAGLLTLTTLTAPFWLVAIVAGGRAAFEVWLPLLAIGGTYATVQVLWAWLVGVELVSIVASAASLGAGVIALRVRRPASCWRFAEDAATLEPSEGDALVSVSRRAGVIAWSPFALLAVMILIWVAPAVERLGTPSVKGWLDERTTWKWEVGPLHQRIARGEAVTGRETPAPADLEAAVLDVAPVSALGTAVLIAAACGGLLAGVGPRRQGKVLLGTLRRMRSAAVAILCMLALGFVTRYSGMDAVLGLAFTRTGPMLYPVFGTFLGWIGTALTGSNTSSNVLFGNLQRITAANLGLPPILMGAANAAGGSMGKMIAAQSIVVASAATGEGGREGEILRASFRHSVAMVACVAAVVWLAAQYAGGISR